MRYWFINGGCFFPHDVWFELCCHFSLYSLHLLESTIVGFKSGWGEINQKEKVFSRSAVSIRSRRSDLLGFDGGESGCGGIGGEVHKLTCLSSFQHPHSHPFFASFTGFQKFFEILPHFSQQLLFITFWPVRSRQAGGKEGNEGRKEGNFPIFWYHALLCRLPPLFKIMRGEVYYHRNHRAQDP